LPEIFAEFPISIGMARIGTQLRDRVPELRPRRLQFLFAFRKKLFGYEISGRRPI
jgi:hypothetical protein